MSQIARSAQLICLLPFMLFSSLAMSESGDLRAEPEIVIEHDADASDVSNQAEPVTNQALEATPLKHTKPITPLKSESLVSSQWPLVLISLVLILTLIFALGWVVRRLGGFKATGQDMSLIASLPLGSKERIALVNVAGQQLVLGVTAQQITLLHTFDQTESGQQHSGPGSPEKTDNQPASQDSVDFVQTLKEALGRQSTP